MDYIFLDNQRVQARVDLTRFTSPPGSMFLPKPDIYELEFFHRGEIKRIRAEQGKIFKYGDGCRFFKFYTYYSELPWWGVTKEFEEKYYNDYYS